MAAVDMHKPGLSDESKAALRDLGFVSIGPWLWHHKVMRRNIHWATAKIRCNAEGKWSAWFGQSVPDNSIPVTFDGAVEAAVWVKLEVAAKWQ